MRLLLIEDDEDTGSAVVEALRARGHAVDWEEDGKSGLDRAASGAHALLIVDRMLPEMDGLSVVTELRRRQVVAPVLMLTALGSVGQRVEGLEGGADDYLVKPFAIAELVARVEALQRRDYPVVQGGVLLTAVLIILINLLVDLLYGVVNPRIRHKK